MSQVTHAGAQVRSQAPDARWIGGEAGHLTLAFLGAVPAEAVAPLALALTTATARHRPFTLELRASGIFGGPRRARVLWIGVGGDLAALQALHGDVFETLMGLGHDLDARPFHPHLTLARARSPNGDPGLAAAARQLADRDFGAQVVTEGRLYESHLGRGGARHEVLARLPLPR